MSIAPKLPKKLTILLQQHTRSPFPSHYPLSADSVKEPQLIVKAVYVSSLTVITQCGITNRENGSEEGGCCECVTIEWTFGLWGQLLWWHKGMQVICVNTTNLIIHTRCTHRHVDTMPPPPGKDKAAQNLNYTHKHPLSHIKASHLIRHSWHVKKNWKVCLMFDFKVG